MQIVVAEIMGDKIYLDATGNLKAVEDDSALVDKLDRLLAKMVVPVSTIFDQTGHFKSSPDQSTLELSLRRQPQTTHDRRTSQSRNSAGCLRRCCRLQGR